MEHKIGIIGEPGRIGSSLTENLFINNFNVNALDARELLLQSKVRLIMLSVMSETTSRGIFKGYSARHPDCMQGR